MGWSSLPCFWSMCYGFSHKGKRIFSIYEIMDMIKKGAVRHFDEDRKVPYIVNKNGEWVRYDDLESYKYKLDYLKKMGLRGTIVWAIDLDDMRTYPLLNAMKNALRPDSVEESYAEPEMVAVSSEALITQDTLLLIVISSIFLTVLVIGFIFLLCLWKRKTNVQDEHQFTLNQGILTLWKPEEENDVVGPVII